MLRMVNSEPRANRHLFQGRAGLVAFRRSRGGVGAMGKAFYKGGFEPKMNKKEASLILSLRYGSMTIPEHWLCMPEAGRY